MPGGTGLRRGNRPRGAGTARPATDGPELRTTRSATAMSSEGVYPLTAPVSIPFLKCFWTNGESAATGSSAITITAIWMASPDS